MGNVRPGRKPTPSPFPLSPSAVELAKLCAEDSPEAVAVRGAFHRTALWKLKTGRHQPEIQTADTLQRLSNGRIAMNGWTVPPKRARRAAVAA